MNSVTIQNVPAVSVVVQMILCILGGFVLGRMTKP